MTRRPVVVPENIGLDTPLRLDVAAAKAFPDGSMSAAGLRRGVKQGLVIFRLAGKDFTTLQDIKDWISSCRRQRASASGSGQPEKAAPPHGSSSTVESRKAQDALDAILKERSKPLKR